MCDEAGSRTVLADLARDPLVRLVMASDGVSEAALLAVLQSAQRAVQARSASTRPSHPLARRRPGGPRLVAAGGVRSVRA